MNSDQTEVNGYRAIREFVLSEMHRRDMSARQFAEFVGVAHGTINKCVNGVEGSPSIDFLIRLARATKTDLSTILALIAPELVHTEVDPKVMILAKRLAGLPDNVQQVIRDLVFKQF